jgi:hypothetical protein
MEEIWSDNRVFEGKLFREAFFGGQKKGLPIKE